MKLEEKNNNQIAKRDGLAPSYRGAVLKIAVGAFLAEAFTPNPAMICDVNTPRLRAVKKAALQTKKLLGGTLCKQHADEVIDLFMQGDKIVSEIAGLALRRILKAMKATK